MKQDTLFSQASVFWIEEFSNEDRTKVPFTSIGNPRTRNSCFRRFILQLSSVSTEQRRTGVLSSAWRLKRKDQMQFLWTAKCWLLWSQKKWNGSPQTEAPGNSEQGHTSFRVLENRVQMTVVWKGLLSVVGYCRKLLPKYELMEKMDGEKSHFLCREFAISRAFKESEVRLAILTGTLIGPVSEVHVVETFGEYGIRVGVLFNSKIPWTHLSLWYPERLNASWTSFINSKQSSGPVMNCSKKSLKKKGCALRREKSIYEPQGNLASSELLETRCRPYSFLLRIRNTCVRSEPFL